MPSPPPAPTYEEMEAKRQEMITSFKDIAAAMLHCVSVIEDYTRLTPSTLANGKQPKKLKAKKDPLAPKKPPSSFLMFSNEIRQEIKEQNPDMGGKEILGIISEKWKNLTPEEKQVFENAWTQKHTEFKDAEETYKQNHQAGAGAATTVDPAITQNAVDKAVEDDASEADSSDSDSSDEDVPPPAPAPVAPTPTPAAKAKPRGRPAKASAAAAAPATPATESTPTAAKAKKETKRKQAEEPVAEPAAAAVTPAADEKKKKKKTAKE